MHSAFQVAGPVPTAATVARLARALHLPEDELLRLRRAAAGETGHERTAGDALGKPIAEWDPHDLEVHPAGTPSAINSANARTRLVLPGYVKREHDRILAEAVRDAEQGQSRIVALVGSSSTGKTRACWEAVQPLAKKGWRLWHPNDPTRAEAALADLERVQSRTVVWLNEAQHYLGDHQNGEHIAAAVNSLLTDANRAPILVLGTLWPNFADQYANLPSPGSADPHSRTRELLAGRVYTIQEAFDSKALREADKLAQAGDQLLSDALTRARTDGRITQDLAGAPELLRRYEHATPAARAMLEAAMDARRLGVGLHLPQAFLTNAATDYLTDHDWDQLTEDWAEAAFADLARDVHGKQAPLRRTAPRPRRRPPIGPELRVAPDKGSVLRLADYLEDHGRTTRKLLCPPASFWQSACAHLTQPEDLSNLADAASLRHRKQWAYHLTQRAADFGHPIALAILGQARLKAGDREGAEVLYRQAAESGDGRTLTFLAWTSEEVGDRAFANDFARRAAQAGDPDVLFLLANRRAESGDKEGAETLLQLAANTGHPVDLTLQAAMYATIGDRESAEALFRRAADAGDASALTSLARLRERAGDQDGAEALIRQAVDAGDDRALADLGRARQQAGDREGAEALFRRAADAGDGFALAELVRLRVEAGAWEAAVALAYQAADSGYMFVLYILLEAREKAGDREHAEAIAQSAGAGHSDALAFLAGLREQAGDREGAEALFIQAADAGGGFHDPRIQDRWPFGLDPDGLPTPPWP
ncbi:hypothetical protein [Kitasatospora nipponensis]|uniref:tetratricopeptide repeat protein n=1 Tax=Kitasatospora nipponensis TaxID=258049 RepID=UPI003CD0AE40